MQQQPTEVEIWDSIVCAYQRSLEHAKHKLAKAKEKELINKEQLIQ